MLTLQLLGALMICSAIPFEVHAVLARAHGSGASVGQEAADVDVQFVQGPLWLTPPAVGTTSGHSDVEIYEL